ncbi:MAG: hypothetical protein U0168_23795 [Nannocystaceae bacterium]
MIEAPPDPQAVERARAQVGAEAERIYDDTKRKVDGEIARMDAAQVWAEHEMDRLTAKALADLEAGRDPDAVERTLQSDLAATIARAQDPSFDPRRLPPLPDIAATAVPAAPAAPPRTEPVAAAPVPAVATRAPAAAPVPAPAAAPAPAGTAPPAPTACACRSDGFAPSLGGIVLAVLARRRRARR